MVGGSWTLTNGPTVPLMATLGQRQVYQHIQGSMWKPQHSAGVLGEDGRFFLLTILFGDRWLQASSPSMLSLLLIQWPWGDCSAHFFSSTSQASFVLAPKDHMPSGNCRKGFQASRELGSFRLCLVQVPECVPCRFSGYYLALHF